MMLPCTPLEAHFPVRLELRTLPPRTLPLHIVASSPREAGMVFKNCSVVTDDCVWQDAVLASHSEHDGLFLPYLQETAEEQGIQAMPTFIFYRNGKKVIMSHF